MKRTITTDFIQSCEKKFREDPVNIVSKNAIVSTGAIISTMSSDNINKISHIFPVSLKGKNTKATNQGASGRCWMFASLNTFRHLLIKVLNVENFEFSEVYLFFWDKFERANTYLEWFIKNRRKQPDSKSCEYMLEHYMSDGGWWNTFANLVQKYGLIPKNIMQPTYQSEDSEDMNFILKEKLDSVANYILKNKKLTKQELNKLKIDTLRDIYNILVKCLGEPPKTFSWDFKDEDEEYIHMPNLTPQKFRELVIPNIDMNKDFVCLANLPPESGLKYNTKYTIRTTNNVQEGVNCTIYNTYIDELIKYTMKSIDSGLSVWFVGDVHRGFNHYHSTLDDSLQETDLVFGNNKDISKGDRLRLKNVEGNHAMAITGYNVDSKGRPISWQVENSWGYWDYETPGMDGFLYMSHDWFKKYVIEIVVARELLSRSFKKQVDSARTILKNAWDCIAPALMVKPIKPPGYYSTLHKKIN